jgi:hypothetical protein
MGTLAVPSIFMRIRQGFTQPCTVLTKAMFYLGTTDEITKIMTSFHLWHASNFIIALCELDICEWQRRTGVPTAGRRTTPLKLRSFSRQRLILTWLPS